MIFNDLLLRRFNEKWIPEPNSGCWLWTANCIWNGYGQITFHQRKYTAHRMSFMLFCGEIPDKLCVCHRCDTKLCVNPDHLFLGTKLENSQDMTRKGRQKSPLARLTPKQVIMIRAATGTVKHIGMQFGISPQHVSDIKNKLSWKNIPDEHDKGEALWKEED